MGFLSFFLCVFKENCYNRAETFQTSRSTGLHFFIRDMEILSCILNHYTRKEFHSFMSNKDISQKALLRVPTVLASLINLLLYDNKPVIQPSQIRYLSISQPFLLDKRFHPLYHDVCVLVMGSKNNRPFIFCIENQTKADRMMPIRCFCYMGAVFLWQMRQIKATKRKKDPVIPLTHLIPCVLFTFHYDRFAWQPKSFAQLFHFDAYPDLKPFLFDYKMNIENISCWSREKIESISSDFRIIADYCAQMRQSHGKQYIPPTHWKIEYIEETLMTLAALSNDKEMKKAFYEYLEQFQPDDSKGEQTMASVINNIIQKGKAEGRREAEKQWYKEKNALNKEKIALNKERNALKTENGEMISTFVIIAQKLMLNHGLSARQACDQLGYSANIRKKVLPFLIS